MVSNNASRRIQFAEQKVKAGGIIMLEVFDRLINELNLLPKHLMDGQRIAFCSQLSVMAQEIAKLKLDVIKTIDEKDKQIEECKQMIKNLNENVDAEPEKGNDE
jgi:hypothetical protein